MNAKIQALGLPLMPRSFALASDMPTTFDILTPCEVYPWLAAQLTHRHSPV
jgi:hypothetical protein